MKLKLIRDMSMRIYSKASIAENPLLCVRFAFIFLHAHSWSSPLGETVPKVDGNSF